jgi:hypothetical protein
MEVVICHSGSVFCLNEFHVKKSRLRLGFFNLGNFKPNLFSTIPKNMHILTQTLKGHNLETVRPFELKFFEEMYFDQLYLQSTRNVFGID